MTKNHPILTNAIQPAKQDKTFHIKASLCLPFRLNKRLTLTFNAAVLTD